MFELLGASIELVRVRARTYGAHNRTAALLVNVLWTGVRPDAVTVTVADRAEPSDIGRRSDHDGGARRRLVLGVDALQHFETAPSIAWDCTAPR